MKSPMAEIFAGGNILPAPPKELEPAEIQELMDILDFGGFGILDLPDGRPAVEAVHAPSVTELRALRKLGMGDLPIYIKVVNGDLTRYWTLESWLADNAEPKPPARAEAATDVPKKPPMSQTGLFK